MNCRAMLFLIFLCGCSTVSTRVAPLGPQEASREKFSILVRTGNPNMDKIVHEIAVMEFGQLLNLNEDKAQLAQCGKMEITFESSTDGGLMGSASTISASEATATGWYDGDQYWGGTGYAAGSSGTLASGSMLSWQNSAMVVTLKDARGARLWTADYEYKGGSDVSGFWVNTAEGAAKVCLKRLKARMRRDLFKGGK
jgi:hypothetical protein